MADARLRPSDSTTRRRHDRQHQRPWTVKQSAEFAARRDYRLYQLLANDPRVLAVALKVKAAAAVNPLQSRADEEESTPAPTSRQPAVEQERAAPPTSSQRNSAQRRSAKRIEKHITAIRSAALLRWRELLKWRPLLVRCLRLHRWHCAQKVAAAHWRKSAIVRSHESPVRPSNDESATNSPPTNPSKKKTKVFKTRQRNLLDELEQEAPPEDDHTSFPPLPSRPHQP